MTNGRRILIFSREYPPVIVGGTSLVARNLANGLARHGWEPAVVTADPAASGELVESADGVTVVRVGTRAVYNANSGLGDDSLRTHRRLHAAAGRLVETVGLPHVIALPDLFCQPEASLLARDLGVPLVNVLLQDFRAITPYDVGAHHVTTGVSADHAHLTDIERKAVLGSDVTVFISRALCDSITAQYGTESFRHQVIHLGIDLEEIAAVEHDGARLERRAALLAATPAGPRTPLVVACGRLVPVKGFDRLITAIARIGRTDRVSGEPAAPPHLALVGTGPKEQSLRRLATELEVSERVTFLGHLSRAEVLGWMSTADVAVVPSLWESFCYVCAEMMALGQPVVATAVDSLIELIPDDTYGYRVPVGGPLGERTVDPDDLAHALRSALTDPQKAAARGAAARRRILEHFTNQRFAREMSALAAELAQGQVRS